MLIGLMVGLLLAAWSSPSVASGGGDDDDWVRTTGDILQIALPAGAGLMTLFTNPDPDATWDREGTLQFAKSFGTAWGSTYLIKILASKARPNGTNRTSFPSGHTMSAFSGASFFDGRYGRAWGIPAYALALFTGYSRVDSGWHYQDDVIAGASIAMISNWYFVSPLPGRVQLLPTIRGSEYGMQLTIRGGESEPAEPFDLQKNPRKASYRFGFGPAYVIKNVAGSQGDGDTRFTLSDLGGFNDPTTTASAHASFAVGKKGAVSVTYGPFEARDQGSFDYDVQFGGALFPAGTPVESSWRFYDLFANYTRTLADSDRWGLTGMVGAGVAYSYVLLKESEGTTEALVDDQTFYPQLGADVEYRLSRNWIVQGGAMGMSIGDEWILDAGAAAVWRPARAWDIALGYKYFSRQIGTDTFYNKVNYHIPFLAVERFW